MAPKANRKERKENNSGGEDVTLGDTSRVPNIGDVSFFRSSRFYALNLWAKPEVEDILSSSLSRVRDSKLSESIKALLAESVEKYLKTFSGWLRTPPSDLPNFLNYCGLSTQTDDNSLSGMLPQPPHIYAILNMKILDALVDATRDDDDFAAEPPPCTPEQSPLVQKNNAPKSGLPSKRAFTGTMQDFVRHLGKLGHSPQWNSKTSAEMMQIAVGEIQNVDEIMKSLFVESQVTYQASTMLRLNSNLLHLALLVRAWCTVSTKINCTVVCADTISK